MPKSYSVEFEVPRTVSPTKKSWQYIAFLDELLMLEKRAAEGKKGFYHSYRAVELKSIYGKNYSKIIDSLVEDGWVDQNEVHGQKGYGTKKPGRYFPYSYRASKLAVESRKKTVAVDIQARILEKKPPILEDKSDLSTPYHRRIKEVFDTLTYEEGGKVIFRYRWWKHRIQRHVANISRKSGRRIYYTAIMCPSAIRSNLKLDGDKLVNIDIRSSVQAFLAQHISNQYNRERWLDIYPDFKKAIFKETQLSSKITAETLKDSFMAAISKLKVRGVASKIRKWIILEFPDLYEFLENHSETAVALTNEIESKFIEKFIMSHTEYKLLPAHDGVFTNNRVYLYVMRALQEFARKEGYKMEFKPEGYGTPLKDNLLWFLMDDPVDGTV